MTDLLIILVLAMVYLGIIAQAIIYGETKKRLREILSRLYE